VRDNDRPMMRHSETGRPQAIRTWVAAGVIGGSLAGITHAAAVKTPT
jgi:hypothetical protein